MHWLEQHVGRLRDLARDLPREAERCRGVLGELIHDIALRRGVSACFACHDGLLVERAGEADFDALAAMAQSFVGAGAYSASALQLGEPEQLLVVGSTHKLALLVVGPFAVGM